MANIASRLTKSAVDTAIPQERHYELLDTTIPGFIVKVRRRSRAPIQMRRIRPSPSAAANAN
ncbi:hypothetical protein GCM10011491_44260 [Brucella endophytica]|uniref:Uncharacterized protein n=1 Tax=Brucella endophytica TaxID=1963359 RepID=A0A916WKV7_9HYPH|nr:hypothetical protein GCM10011491_44260 [Brucella endophytica]